MSTLELYFIIFLGIQFFHSIEELTQCFHKRFPFGKLKFKTFLSFEILFFGLWILIFFLDQLAIRNQLLAFFMLLMFANGLWHLVWWGIEKKYVPGLITAPLFVIGFVIYYFQILF